MTWAAASPMAAVDYRMMSARTARNPFAKIEEMNSKHLGNSIVQSRTDLGRRKNDLHNDLATMKTNIEEECASVTRTNMELEKLETQEEAAMQLVKELQQQSKRKKKDLIYHHSMWTDLSEKCADYKVQKDVITWLLTYTDEKPYSVATIQEVQGHLDMDSAIESKVGSLNTVDSLTLLRQLDYFGLGENEAFPDTKVETRNGTKAEYHARILLYLGHNAIEPLNATALFGSSDENSNEDNDLEMERLQHEMEQINQRKKASKNY
jgi:hypothetical protein